MRTNRVLAYCPRCRQSRRFSRANINHGFHAAMTALTLGLWGVSWLAVAVGQWIQPWRCKHCSCPTPDFSRALPTSPQAAPPAFRPVGEASAAPARESLTAV